VLKAGRYGTAPLPILGANGGFSTGWSHISAQRNYLNRIGSEQPWASQALGEQAIKHVFELDASAGEITSFRLLRITTKQPFKLLHELVELTDVDALAMNRAPLQIVGPAVSPQTTTPSAGGIALLFRSAACNLFRAQRPAPSLPATRSGRG
jgi:hypothetical protein